MKKVVDLFGTERTLTLLHEVALIQDNGELKFANSVGGMKNQET